jgi:hypothetical protein
MKNIISWNSGGVFQDNQQNFGNNLIWNNYLVSPAVEEKISFTLFIDQQRDVNLFIDQKRDIDMFIDQKRDFSLEL